RRTARTDPASIRGRACRPARPARAPGPRRRRSSPRPGERPRRPQLRPGWREELLDGELRLDCPSRLRGVGPRSQGYAHRSPWAIGYAMVESVIATPSARKLLSILCLLAAAPCGCGPRDSRKAGVSRGAPIVLISIDPLRSDHLPAYGYRGVATPAIDALRRDSILFERAFSHAPLTLPSHVSLLTGLVPSEHGVRDNL